MGAFGNTFGEMGGGQRDFFVDPSSYSDLNFWAKGRSGFTIPDDFGNNATIYTPSYRSSTTGHYLDGLNTRVDELLLDGDSYTLYFKFKDPSGLFTGQELIKFGGGDAVNRRGLDIRLYNNTGIRAYASDGITRLSTTTITPGTLSMSKWYEVLIQIDYNSKLISISLYDEETYQTRTIDISTFVFNSTINYSNYSTLYCLIALDNLKKFRGIKTISQCRNYSYITDIQIYYPNLISGIDISGNSNHLTRHLFTEDDKYYDATNNYLMDYGYSLYKLAGSPDIYIPNYTDGTPLYTTWFTNYVNTKNYPGNLNYFNLTDAMVEFSGSIFDRSNTTIYADEARLNFYNAITSKRWHSSELNKLIMNDYFNLNYKGLIFPKCLSNSYDNRNYLEEIFAYNANKTGDRYNAILRYTGDLAINSMLYLKNPYTQIPQITAIVDSVFRFKINNSIYYNDLDIKSKTDLIRSINSNENFTSKVFRWVMSNSAFADRDKLITRKYQDAFIVINNNAKKFRLPYISQNVYPYVECLAASQLFYGILKNYNISNNKIYNLGHVSHSINSSDIGYLDGLYGVTIFNSLYNSATVSDITNDKYLWTEPLKIYNGIYRERSGTSFNAANWAAIADGSYNSYLWDTPEVPELYMKMPGGSTLKLPVKSSNVPVSDFDVPLTHYANIIFSAGSGIIGIVEMPFNLLQITGTGQIQVDNIVYTLPVDEITLKTNLQRYEKFYNVFEILTNTGGIQAEYLVSRRLIQLDNYNQLNTNLVSGSISVDKVVTMIPLPTYVLSVTTNDYDTQWSITQDKYYGPTSLRVVDTDELTSEVLYINFYKEGKRPEPQTTLSGTGGDRLITAGTPVYDKCFAGILTPKQDTFSSTLELTFTSVDESSCYYTLDGSTPDATKTLYTAPFTISSTTTIKWINIKTDYANSHVNSRIITKI